MQKIIIQWGYLFLFAFLSFIFLPTSIVNAQIKRTPGFSCSEALDPASAFTCEDDELARASLQLSQAYYALRGATPPSLWQSYKQTGVEFLKAELRHCDLPPHGSVPADRIAATKQCLLNDMQQQRSFWLNQLASLQKTEAVEEATRSPEANLQLQQILKHQGWLPSDAEVDGVFGEATRQAIRKMQASKGLASTGILSNATELALSAASLTNSDSTLERLRAAQRQMMPTRTNTEARDDTTANLTKPQLALTDTPTTNNRPTQLNDVQLQFTDIEWRQASIGMHFLHCWTSDAASAPKSVRLIVTLDKTKTVRMADVVDADRGRLNDPLFRAFAECVMRTARDSCCADLSSIIPEDIIIDRTVMGLRISIPSEEEARRFLDEKRRRDAIEATRQEKLAVERRRAEQAKIAALQEMEARRLMAREASDFQINNFRKAIADIKTIYRSHEPTLLEKILNYSFVADEDGKFRPSELIDLLQSGEKSSIMAAGNDIYDNIIKGKLRTLFGVPHFYIDFWISGYEGADKCVMTHIIFKATENAAPQTDGPAFKSYDMIAEKSIDIRKLSRNGFRLRYEPQLGWILGDEKLSMYALDYGQLMERLKTAWGLAFDECPGKKSEF